MSKGVHIILDCWNVPRELCVNDRLILDAVARAAVSEGATIINTSRYLFGQDSPPGCTVFVMMDESHISVHTYADEGKMAIDVFVCGDADAQGIADRLKTDLGLKKFQQQSLDRF